MAKRAPRTVLVGVFLLLFLVVAIQPLQAALKRVRIPDNLDDVVDDEEDDEWKAWGTPKPKSRPAFNPPPDFVEGMDIGKYQSEMMKRHVGPTTAFVKLRIDIPREKEEAPQIARKWAGLLRSGTIDAKVVAVDRSTIMVTVPEGEDVMEVKDFMLTQPEAYEFKLGQSAFRRPGDPPLDVVLERLKQEKEKKSQPVDNDSKEDL